MQPSNRGKEFIFCEHHSVIDPDWPSLAKTPLHFLPVTSSRARYHGDLGRCPRKFDVCELSEQSLRTQGKLLANYEAAVDSSGLIAVIIRSAARFSALALTKNSKVWFCCIGKIDSMANIWCNKGKGKGMRFIDLYPLKCPHNLPPLAGLYTRKPFQSPGGYSRAAGSI